MFSGIWFEILFVGLLIALNGSLAMAEIAIVSSRKARLQPMINAGSIQAEVVLQPANEPSKFLSIIQNAAEQDMVEGVLRRGINSKLWTWMACGLTKC